MTSDQSPRYADAISGIESGGNYGALGPATSSGDRAYGKYQIMGANIPAWTKEHYGEALTPEQFLNNQAAQDATFNGQFGKYVAQFGPEGAAQAWIGGPGGVGKLDRKDGLGTSIGAYGAKFMKALGQPQGAPEQTLQPPMSLAAPQMAAGAVQPNSMPAYGWSPNNAPAQAPESQPSQNAPLSLNPINYAQRRPPDLTQLQAFLQRSRQPLAAFSFSRTS